MIDEDEFDAASEADADMAFVRLERKFRIALEDKIEGSPTTEAYKMYVLEYMNHAIAAAEALEIASFVDWIELDPDEYYKQYNKFITYVDRFKVNVQISFVRKATKFAVPLSIPEKDKVRHYVAQIKIIVDESGLSVAKKERLYNKINEFLAELDRDRTRFEVFSDFMTSFAHLGGEMAQEAEPAWKWFKLIGEVLGARKETEQLKLPQRQTPKRIEHQKSRNSSDFNNDDIPF